MNSEIIFLSSENNFPESSSVQTGLNAFGMPTVSVFPVFLKRSLFSSLFCEVAPSDWMCRDCTTFFFLILFVSSSILCNFATLFGVKPREAGVDRGDDVPYFCIFIVL